MNIGLSIREIRKEKNITQGELAKLSGFTQSYICSIEKSRKFPETIAISKICLALGIKIGDLMINAMEPADFKNELMNLILPIIKRLV